MRSRRALLFFYLFVTASIVHVAAEAFSAFLLAASTKTLPLALLFISFYLEVSSKSRFKGYILSGLLFSLLGDLLLLLARLDETYFLLGLSSFLVAHIFYILAFSGYARQRPPGYVKAVPLAVLPFAAYVIGLSFWWWGDLGGLRLPVVAYSLVITAMGISALNLRNTAPLPVFLTLMAGAIFFIVSDTMIAVEKFKVSIPYPGYGSWQPTSLPRGLLPGRRRRWLHAWLRLRTRQMDTAKRKGKTTALIIAPTAKRRNSL
ncbi:MAG: lysoplasmalogenase [Haliscomenobacter sp.]|nr:lysoplasmalogenase [Haliscomenobacter sp.]